MPEPSPFKRPEWKQGVSSMYRVPIHVTQEHIDRKYSKREQMQSGVVYCTRSPNDPSVRESYEARFQCPTNPLEAAYQETLGIMDITIRPVMPYGGANINGHGYTLDLPDYLFLKHWLQGRPTKPYTASIDLHGGRLPGE